MHAGKVVNESCIEWEDNIYIPVVYRKEFGFEIYNVHQFGYHPQELVDIYTGSLSIRQPGEAHSAWEVFDPENNKIGYLSADIRANRNVWPSESKIPNIFNTDPKNITIKSFVSKREI